MSHATPRSTPHTTVHIPHPQSTLPFTLYTPRFLTPDVTLYALYLTLHTYALHSTLPILRFTLRNFAFYTLQTS